MKTRRPYRLERVGCNCSTQTYATLAGAEGALSQFVKTRCREGDTWRLTMRAEKGRKTTLVAEGVVK